MIKTASFRADGFCAKHCSIISLLRIWFFVFFGFLFKLYMFYGHIQTLTITKHMVGDRRSAKHNTYILNILQQNHTFIQPKRTVSAFSVHSSTVEFRTTIWIVYLVTSTDLNRRIEAIICRRHCVSSGINTKYTLGDTNKGFVILFKSFWDLIFKMWTT